MQSIDVSTLNQLLNKTLAKGRVCETKLKLCQDLSLYLFDPTVLEGPISHEEAQAVVAEPAYWSFCWASGQALSFFINKHPELVRGKIIVDFGSGSGVVAIACAKAGAKKVYALDIDEDAIVASSVNAQLNGVQIETCKDFSEIPESIDCLVASDVLYDSENIPMLDTFAKYTSDIILADSRLKLMPNNNYHLVETIEACTWPDLNEFEEFNKVRIYLTKVPKQLITAN